MPDYVVAYWLKSKIPFPNFLSSPAVAVLLGDRLVKTEKM